MLFGRCCFCATCSIMNVGTNGPDNRWRRLDVLDSPPSSLPCSIYGFDTGVLISAEVVLNSLLVGSALSFLRFLCRAHFRSIHESSHIFLFNLFVILCVMWLLALVHPLVQVYTIPKSGQLAYVGHICNFHQKVSEFLSKLPTLWSRSFYCGYYCGTRIDMGP